MKTAIVLFPFQTLQGIKFSKYQNFEIGLEPTFGYPGVPKYKASVNNKEVLVEAELFEANCILSADVIKAIDGALSSRGKHKGMLKAKCPPMNTPEAAAWQAITSNANPYEVGLGHCIFMDRKNRLLMDYIDHTIINGGFDVSCYDRDRKALGKFF